MPDPSAENQKPSPFQTISLRANTMMALETLIEKSTDRIIAKLDEIALIQSLPDAADELLDIPGPSSPPDLKLVDAAVRDEDVILSPMQKLKNVIDVLNQLGCEESTCVMFKAGTNTVNVDMTLDELSALWIKLRNVDA